MCPSSSPCDIVPTTFLKAILLIWSPSLLSIINSSLTSGSVPDLFKIASIQPLLKKPSLNLDQLENYRPISKLPFYLGSLKKFRLLRVSNNILNHADRAESSILIHLDLTAAFDNIDHAILLHRLQNKNCSLSFVQHLLPQFEALVSLSLQQAGRRPFLALAESTCTCLDLKQNDWNQINMYTCNE